MSKSLYPIIMIVLAIGIYFTITKDVLTQAKVIQSSNTEYVKAIESATKLIKLRDQVLVDYNGISMDDRIKLNKVVPASVDNIRLIIDLNGIAMRHNFSLKDVKVSASGPTNGQDTINSNLEPGAEGMIATPSLDSVSVTFSLNAPYQQFISFLQDLESSLRIFDVASLSLVSNDNGIYTWTMNIKTYWLRKP